MTGRVVVKITNRSRVSALVKYFSVIMGNFFRNIDIRGRTVNCVVVSSTLRHRFSVVQVLISSDLLRLTTTMSLAVSFQCNKMPDGARTISHTQNKCQKLTKFNTHCRDVVLGTCTCTCTCSSGTCTCTCQMVFCLLLEIHTRTLATANRSRVVRIFRQGRWRGRSCKKNSANVV